MPRKARIKTDQSIFHIICKSISEVDLFKDDKDKEKYLLLIKKYKDIYKFKLYGYCLMDNHVHLMIDANGADISKLMHGINFCYAMYFNKKHNRCGHLFKDRFKSIIITNERHLRTLSLYIHNNPTDIGEYKNSPEKYAFSSLAIYLGQRHDTFKLVDYGFMISFFGNDINHARKKYYKLIFRCNEEKLKEEIEFQHEETEYRSERTILVRNFKSEDIIEFIAKKMHISSIKLFMKYSRKLVEAKALVVVLMRSLCGFNAREVCRVLGNISQTRVSVLSTIGVELIGSNKDYGSIIEDFIECYAS